MLIKVCLQILVVFSETKNTVIIALSICLFNILLLCLSIYSAERCMLKNLNDS